MAMKQLELATAASSPAFSQARLGCRVLHCNITDMAVGDCCTIPIQAGTFLGCRVSGRLPADTVQVRRTILFVHFSVQGMVRPMSRWLIPGLVCARTCCRSLRANRRCSMCTWKLAHLEGPQGGVLNMTVYRV